MLHGVLRGAGTARQPLDGGHYAQWVGWMREVEITRRSIVAR